MLVKNWLLTNVDICFITEPHVKPEQKFKVSPFITINHPYQGCSRRPPLRLFTTTTHTKVVHDDHPQGCSRRPPIPRLFTTTTPKVVHDDHPYQGCSRRPPIPRLFTTTKRRYSLPDYSKLYELYYYCRQIS